MVPIGWCKPHVEFAPWSQIAFLTTIRAPLGRRKRERGLDKQPTEIIAVSTVASLLNGKKKTPMTTWLRVNF